MKKVRMKIGLAADHGGLELKQAIKSHLTKQKHEIMDFGAAEMNKDDDYPDYVLPMARAISKGEVNRGLLCAEAGWAHRSQLIKSKGFGPP